MICCNLSKSLNKEEGQIAFELGTEHLNNHTLYSVIHKRLQRFDHNVQVSKYTIHFPPI